MEICTNIGVLKVIQFFLIIVDILKVIIPIVLIVLGIIDFSKSVTTNDEKVHKKSVNVFITRLLCAVLVFALPWIIEVIMITLGDLLGEEGRTNFTDCIDNANKETIQSIENGTYGWACYVCKTDSTLKAYKQKEPMKSVMCKNWKKTTQTKEECAKDFKCYVCKTDETLKAFTAVEPMKSVMCKNWKKTDLSKEECK